MSHPPIAAPDARLHELADAAPQDILSWAVSTNERVAIATSFQSSGVVLLHMLRSIAPRLPVLFLDTGFHFRETLELAAHLEETWDLNLVRIRGRHGSVAEQERLHGADLHRRDPALCCRINKVEPLQEHLDGYDAWISGIRRDQSPLRAATPMVEAQTLPSGAEILKIHPLAHWCRSEVAAYVKMHDLPTHPLLELGYRSIGCAPCTRPVAEGEAERAGRWDGFAKTECGIHTFGRRGEASEAEQ